MPRNELVGLERTRNQLARLGTRRNQLLVELAAAESQLSALARDAPAARKNAAEKRVRALRDRLKTAARDEVAKAKEIERLRDRLRLPQPEASVQRLDGRVPVTLLPVRLETRFGDGGTSLRIRVFPEQVHVDSHEPELTPAERAAGEAYWRDRWAAMSNVEQRRAAWRRLVGVVRPTRARWLVQATTPRNVETLGTGEPQFPGVAERPAAWTRAPVARLLPEQWVAIGFKNGVKVFQEWSAPVAETVAVGPAPNLAAAPATAPPPIDQGELVVDDGMKWMVDYDEAVRVGMALTVTDAHLARGRLADGLDELVVLGVDWTLRPDAAAAAVAEQVGRHAVSDGLALLAPGTPTNNDEEERAAAGTDPALDPDAQDPADVDPGVAAAGERVARALGLASAASFAGVPGHGQLDDGHSADMNTVLWAPTVGYFCDEMMRPLVTTATADQIAAHFRRFVRGRGPFACLRVGRQPYGVLPVLAGDVTWDDPFERAVWLHTAAARQFWFNSSDRVPRLGDSDRPDVDLVELLRRRPRSATFRFRQATASAVTMNLFGFDLAAVFQEHLALLLLQMLGVSGRPEIAGVTANPNHRLVPVPLVAPGQLSETAPLEPNYLDSLRAVVSGPGGLRRLVDDPATASSLLEALLRHAAALEIAVGSVRVVVSQEVKARVLAEAPARTWIPEREIHGLAVPAQDDDVDVDDDAPSVFAKATAPLELGDVKLASVTGKKTVADWLTTSPVADLLRFRETERFVAFRAALGRLSQLPGAELGRLAAETLDCASHRLDAWITSMATRRLERLRADKVAGCHVGAFGYVEDLAPQGAATSLGYLHAPSVPHATTAAILRSGHLARREDDDGVLALDLSSTRVSLALELLEGVQRGQPIGALLGYRFERGLRDRSVLLAKYILPLRQAAPLASAEGMAAGPVETIAARDVVDGVRLLKRWKQGRDALYDGLSIAVPAADRAEIDKEIRRLDEAFDAVSDVLVAEGVHQAVLGNSARSAAALDALDRHAPIPDIGVVRTPRSGDGAGHRLLVLLPSAAPAAGWEALSDPRRAVEPRVDAWAGAVLGRADRFRFAAEVHDAEGGVVQRLRARLSDLGLSALGTVCACAASGAGGSTELEERLYLHLLAAVSAPGAAGVVLLEDPPAASPASALGLRDLLELGAEILGLLAGARVADARALAPDSARPEAGVDVGELQARADAAVEALRSAAAAAGAVPAGDTATAVTALLGLAAAGRRNAVPARADAGEVAALLTAESAGASAVVTELDAAEVGFDRTTATAAEQAAHDLARLRRVFGEAFPVLPVFTTPTAVDLTSSSRDAALLDGDALAPSTWLAQHAVVRAPAGRLAGVLAASEMLGGGVGLAPLTVAQLPFAAGDRWLGLARDVGAARPAASVSIVVHSPGRLDFARPLAGLVVDQWSDAIPRSFETTGMSFHFDAPGARAPQTIVVAVPGNRQAAAWTVDALAGVVRETMALARIRAVDPDDLEAMGRFLPAIYLPFNIERKTPSLNLSAIIAAAIEAENVAFESNKDEFLGRVR